MVFKITREIADRHGIPIERIGGWAVFGLLTKHIPKHIHPCATRKNAIGLHDYILRQTVKGARA